MWNITNFPVYQNLCQVTIADPLVKNTSKKVLKLFIVDSSVQIGKNINVRVVWKFYKGKNGNCTKQEIMFYCLSLTAM